MTSAPTPEALILDDAEWALMDAFEALGPAWLGMAQEADLLSRAAARRAFSADRLAEALATLEEKAVVLRSDGAVLSLSQRGSDLLAARRVR